MQSMKIENVLGYKNFRQIHKDVLRNLRNRFKDCSREDAEDIFMEAWLKLEYEIQAGKFNYQNKGALISWLNQACQNLFWATKNKKASLLKKTQNYVEHQLYTEENNTPPSFGEELTEVKYDMITLLKALDKLCEKCERLLMERYGYGKKPKEIYESGEYGYKNPRVITDAIIRCKKKLIKFLTSKKVKV